MILVNNAGITIDKTVLKMTDDDWFKVLAVNLSGASFMSKAVLPHMIERGSGRIVNLSSIVGEMGNIGQANCAASKSGLFGLTKTLAREAAFLLQRAGKLDDNGVGLTVNTVCAGIHRNRDARAHSREGAGRQQGQDPARTPRAPGGNRTCRALPLCRWIVIRHRQIWGINGGMDM